MKIKGLVVLTIVIAMIAGSCGQSSVKNAKMKSVSDTLSYAFGIVNYNALVNDSLMLDPMLVAKAMLDGKKGEPAMSDDEARAFIMVYVNKREEDRAAKQAEQNKVLYKDYIMQNEEFLQKNKEKQGVTVTPSGLQYEVIKMGTGAKPTAESTVKVHYTVTLVDGTKFDSSVDRGQPAEFPVSGVIQGWTEALQLMPVGSKFKIYLPENIAYGANGAGDVIKPFSTLIFEVELLEITR
ncbi:MAG TPA: FKBP-type peptidyl-prolyl cis-trans isomerase [Bacteroidales bacterium]|jgi:FKBP-type peptidyl-prolyl cis-trans isomerase|nr:FKBP-type peptidyl-prolyl cis-trans isomerase [Bacteroidales bacterium]NMD02953.1 FKBP-type peptidyl-prolyl cis-trans isomerase [Bacteroidales bacterium]HOU01654.1 FKBP-type peptidyl-prolyl cis-trans isomerase [Bacteroidales bacterium]HQG63441.1 FKBP-type peptidyl-prolyl cis-trans isomerase [Bacteroidales bacterium]HQK66902.1 FKBP-type peptidyl-prolyl cis-trans isomerase [Bacteroidales bacterium]